MVETVFDTLNCKAALFGIKSLFEDIGNEVTNPASGMGVWYMHRLAEKKWQDIDV